MVAFLLVSEGNYHLYFLFTFKARKYFLLVHLFQWYKFSRSVYMDISILSVWISHLSVCYKLKKKKLLCAKNIKKYQDSNNLS